MQSTRWWVVVTILVCGCSQRHARSPELPPPDPEPGYAVDPVPAADSSSPSPAADREAEDAGGGEPTTDLCAMVGEVIASLPTMEKLHVGDEHAYSSGGRFWLTDLGGMGEEDERGTVQQDNLRTPPQFNVFIDSSEPPEQALAGAVAQLQACPALRGATFEETDDGGGDGLAPTFTWSGERPRFAVERKFDVELSFDDGITLRVRQWGVL